MDERILKFRVGVMVLATLIITSILVLLFGNVRHALRRTYTVEILFDDAEGVTEDTPVRKSGILIGRVTGVTFADDGRAKVIAEINADVELGPDHECRISRSLLGETSLQFVQRKRPQQQELPDSVHTSRGGRRAVISVLGTGTLQFVQLQKPPELEAPPAGQQRPRTFKGVSPRDPVELLEQLGPKIESMVDSVTRTSDEIRSVAAQLNRAFSEEDSPVVRSVARLEKTLESIGKAADNLNEVLSDPQLKADLKQGLSELPKALRESRDAFSGLKQTLELADRNLQNLEGFTRPLGQRGDELFLKLDRSATKLERLLDNLNTFGTAINDRQGSLGRLMSDPELYDNLSEAAGNINDLTKQLRPIVNDVRVFTDKIARDPGRIGVRGVFQQNSGVK
jgi:phospholipid/cholesterol/gamma-HCH transport system substrate-binding protein